MVERRERTRSLIELGGLIMKAGLVNLTGDDGAIILGALLWMTDKLQSNQGEQARALWAANWKQAFEADAATHRTVPAADNGQRISSKRYPPSYNPKQCIVAAVASAASRSSPLVCGPVRAPDGGR
jgi:hypothetical protein